MKSKLAKRIAVLMAVAVMGMTTVACGGSNASSTALTEEEYLTETQELVTAMNDVVTKAGSIDPTDVEGAKQLIEDCKAPLVEFAALEAPEKYAEAHAKYKSGCEAMVEYLDMAVDAMDPEKAADLDMEKMVNLIQTAQTDLMEADSLMQEAMK